MRVDESFGAGGRSKDIEIGMKERKGTEKRESILSFCTKYIFKAFPMK